MQIVFERIFGVLIKSSIFPRDPPAVVFVLIACFSRSILIDSVGRLLNAAAFSNTVAESSMRPTENNQRGLKKRTK